MKAAIPILLVVFNVYLIGRALASSGYAFIAEEASLERLLALAVALAPSVGTLLFAFWRTTRRAWGTALSLNVLAVIGLGALTYLARALSGSRSGPPVAQVLPAAAVLLVNVAYLVWRTPPAPRLSN